MLWWTLRKLNSPDPVSRATAARLLSNSREPKVVERLIEALNDSSDLVVLEVVTALDRIGAVGAVGPLCQKLQGCSADLKNRIAHVLTCNQTLRAHLGDRNACLVEAQIWKLKSSDPVSRVTAARELGQSSARTPKVVPCLIDALNDQSDPVVLEVMEALTRIGDVRAVEPIYRMLGSSTVPRNIQFAALQTLLSSEKFLLGYIHDKHPDWMPVLDIWKEAWARGLSDSQVMHALAGRPKFVKWPIKLEGQAAIDMLVGFLTTGSLGTIDWSPWVSRDELRVNAIEVLGTLGVHGDRQLIALLASDKMNDHERTAIVNSVGSALPDAAATALITLSNDMRNPYLAKAAAERVIELSRRRNLGPALREAAATALITISNNTKDPDFAEAAAACVIELSGHGKEIFPGVLAGILGSKHVFADQKRLIIDNVASQGRSALVAPLISFAQSEFSFLDVSKWNWVFLKLANQAISAASACVTAGAREISTPMLRNLANLMSRSKTFHHEAYDRAFTWDEPSNPVAAWDETCTLDMTSLSEAAKRELVRRGEDSCTQEDVDSSSPPGWLYP